MEYRAKATFGHTIVEGTPAAIPADADSSHLETIGEGGSGVLATMVGIEDLGRRLFHRNSRRDCC